jgi:hypothetical protein
MMYAILKCSGRVVEVERIPGDADHMVVYGTVFRRTVWDAVGLRPVHLIPIDKLEIIPVSETAKTVACRRKLTIKES